MNEVRILVIGLTWEGFEAATIYEPGTSPLKPFLSENSYGAVKRWLDDFGGDFETILDFSVLSDKFVVEWSNPDSDSFFCEAYGS